MQDLALGHIERHDVHTGPPLQLFQVHLDDITSFWHVNCSNQLSVICRLAEGALDHAVYVVDENKKPVELEKIHACVASPNPPEPLQSWQSDPPAGCFDISHWLDSYGYGHPCDALLQPASPGGQPCLATLERPRCVCFCNASCSASIAVAAPTEHFPPSKSQYRDKILAISLIPQYLKPAGWLSPLQADLIDLALQQHLRLIM